MKIIAELGSNWKTFEDCKDACSIAKKCGADAIKFQLYSHQELFGHSGRISAEMPRDWIPLLASKCQAVGIEFMCTAFSVEGLKITDPYVETHKLASSEMNHVDMIRFLETCGKEIIVSTGGHTETDIQIVNNMLENAFVVFLHCEASYPSNHSNLRKILRLRELTGRPAGLSDHSLDVFNIPLMAFEYGADLLEKHYNPFNYTDTPDAGHSLSSEDFLAMTKNINTTKLPVVCPSKEELAMILRHNRRMIATRVIKVGDTLRKDDNYGIYRSLKSDLKGAHPVSMIDNQVSRHDYNVGDAIEPKQ